MFSSDDLHVSQVKGKDSPKLEENNEKSDRDSVKNYYVAQKAGIKPKR